MALLGDIWQRLANLVNGCVWSQAMEER